MNYIFIILYKTLLKTKNLCKKSNIKSLLNFKLIKIF